MTVIKFALNCATFGAVVYYLQKAKVWHDSTTTNELGKKLASQIAPNPYFVQLQNAIPYQFQELPSRHDIARAAYQKWNGAVITSIKFVRNIPTCTMSYVNKGIIYVSNEFNK